MGLSRARNVGLKAVTGEIIAFPDDDCWYPDGLLQKVVAEFRDQTSLDGLTGRSEDGKLVEMVEIPDHPWFMACQFHPEFTSGPREGHPLFTGFIKAALEKKNLSS